jgi:methionine sulfoxide reductase heme-binding subunit
VSPARRLSLIKLAVLVLSLLPALELALRWWMGRMGARPTTEALLWTGDWAVAFLLISLAITPARAVFDWPPLITLRRRLGLAAAGYALLHFMLYVFDQKWNLVVVALEIVKRFYLTIGFVALLIFIALSITSTDGWQRRLRRNWKRLHYLAYPLAVLALVHFFLQSKANVSDAVIAAGLFLWLMLWRLLPRDLRNRPLTLAGLAIAAPILTVIVEALWYWGSKNVPPMRIVEASFDPTLFPRPAHIVLIAGFGVLAASLLWRIRLWRTAPS